MFQTNIAREPQGEGVDADAVCSKCHTINTEDVLICKACGNNLRDQRHERLGEEELLFGAEKGRKRKFLMRSLGALGFLTIIWVAINANDVADWTVRVASSAQSDGRMLWEGEEGAAFDALAAELKGFSVPRQVLRRAIENTKISLIFEGKYVLINGSDVIGYAVARKIDNVLYVAAATLNEGELRLKLTQEGVALSLTPGNAGGFIDGYRAPIGRIRQDKDGIFRIGGRDEITGQVFACKAYRLPAQ